MTRSTLAALLLFGTAFLSTSPLEAQVDTGTISGLVADASGAHIPEARVTVLQVKTNQKVELTTNGSGYYAAPGLRSGRYEVIVLKDGFRSQKSQQFDLRVQDHTEVNFQLDVGSITSEITVSASAPLLESETSSLGQVVEERTITDLPLNGRNFIQLATLAPGTLPSNRTAERDNFVSNGARPIQNSYLLDGVDNKNRIMGFDKSSAQIIQPIIDGIQEFKVQTATFSAEFGQAAGGVVNVTLKSGTNAFHGNLFEFFRNKVLNASPYFQPAGGGKPSFIQNQFGATFGGPIVKDRTFFFGSWQTSREINGAPQIASVPTASQLAGQFGSMKIYDPATTRPNPKGSGFVRDLFPNNTVPQSRWDSVATKLIALYPAQNLSGSTRNYFYDPAQRVSNDQYNIRVDHRFSDKDFMFGRFSQVLGTNVLPTPLPDPANQQGTIDPGARSMSLSETHLISPNVFNEVRFGYSYTHVLQDTTAERLFDQYGIRGALETDAIKGLPVFNISGFSSLGTVGPGATPIQATGSGNFPSEKSGTIYQFLDNISWVHSRHTFKFGVDIQHVSEDVYATNSARPSFNFNGVYTQNPQSRAGTGSPFADFLLGYTNTAATSTQQQNTIEQNVYQAYVQDDWKITSRLTLNLGIRYELTRPFSEAKDLQSNLILDGGSCYLQLITVADAEKCGLDRRLVNTDANNFAPRVGLAYQANRKTVIRSGFGMFYGRDENLGILRRLPNNPPYTAGTTYTADQINPNIILATGFPANSLNPSTSNPDVNSMPKDFLVPYVVQWNLNLERELGHGLVAQLGYTGSGAKKLYSVVNVNQAFPGAGSVNARRPYQGYGNINFYAPLTNSTYHALLAKLERRFSSGVSLLASYTYGHSIDGGGNNNDVNDPTFQNSRDLASQKGSSNFDIRHSLVLSGVYELPFKGLHGISGAVLHGWQTSGIFSWHTGTPFTPTLNTDPTTSGTIARPNRLREGSLPSDQRDPQYWFDVAAFVAPTGAVFGNSGRDILRGPGFVNLDLGVQRDFVFTERLRLQARGEAFNLFNHPNLGLPASTIGAAGVGIIGSVVSPERQLQVALKLFF